jgi:nuclear pore complex protein Nup205
VMERGNAMERSQWFLDIEPLFKLLSYEIVPPYLKGALRDAIATFVIVSPGMKNKVWSLLEQYDLPVVATPLLTDGSVQQLIGPVYDMTYELNEVEARQEEYPSTLSYLNLLNVLIAQDLDIPDKGSRYIGIFRFVRDQVFAPYTQRAYANPVEKWELVAAALRHFEIMFSFHLTEDDVRKSADHLLPPENSLPGMASPGLGAGNNARLPTMELMKDLMSGRVVYRNLMSILCLGVNSVMEQRTDQLYGPALEKSVSLCLQILLLALEKDFLFAEAWRPVYQPIDLILCQDIRQIVTVLEYVRYDTWPLIQRCPVQIMKLLSARMPQLVSIILEAGTASSLVEDYAACLETRTEEVQAPEDPEKDIGSLILRLLLSNLHQPPPNLTHLLLKFDINQPVEMTMLQPKRHFSCLRVILRAFTYPAGCGRQDIKLE